MSDPDGTAPEPPPIEEVPDEPTVAPRVRPVLGGRAAARERALHLLYETAMKDRGASEVLAGQVLAADHYAEELVGGVEAHREEIDGLISELAPKGWTLQRMATLDRTLLQIGCFELLHRPEVPTGVVLAEAVELAETYGADDSPRFVNGLLAAAARQVRPD